MLHVNPKEFTDTFLGNYKTLPMSGRGPGDVRPGAFKFGRCFCIKNNRPIQKTSSGRRPATWRSLPDDFFNSLTPKIIVRLDSF
jgi:hypothetical protein